MDETKCVRIVEDSDVLAEMLGFLLDMEGVRHCKTTNNFQLLLGPDCWEGVTTVLCDLDLGGPITGVMVLEYLKETHPWIKRVVLSAVAEVRGERVLSLAHAVLAKPADLEKIVEAVQ
jgi:DNA-binding NtrC family response regulator